MQRRTPVYGSLLNMSDNDDDDNANTIKGSDDDVGSMDDFDGDAFASDAYFKPKIDEMTFAEVKNGDIVELSSIEDHTTLYIRAIKHDEKMINMLAKMNKQKHNKLSLFVPLKKNDIVLMKHAGDFTRASVIDDERSTLRLIDIGTAVQFEADDVRYISPEVFVATILAVSVHLKLPIDLCQAEKTAVISHLAKQAHKRFMVCSSKNLVEANDIIDLKNIQNNRSVTLECLGHVEVKMSITDIKTKKIRAQDVDLVIVDNSYLSKGFICCVLKEDAALFATQVKSLSDFGESLASGEPYIPTKFELCLVCFPDENQERLWYRGQFQQILAGGKAQIGLIDFASEVIVSACDIKKMDRLHGYERISLICKIRNDDISMDLLDHTQLEEYHFINATRIHPAGDAHEIYLSNDFFFLEQNFD